MAGIKYEIIEEIGVISEGSKGWRKEINLVSWNGNEVKYDIRDWGPDHEKMGKGITLSTEEAFQLRRILDEIPGIAEDLGIDRWTSNGYGINIIGLQNNTEEK